MAAELKINVANPEAITYQTEELGFTILGGIRIDGLDRLRVTMKIEVINRQYEHYLNNPDIANLAIRHNLDLYNDVQVEKLIRKTAERLEVGSTQLTKAVAEITSQLELYRLQELEAKQTEKEVRKKILSVAETEEARIFLEQDGLMQITNELIGKSGVIGEEANRLLMYIIFTSRKRNNPLHIISFGSSGAGKSHLQEKVAELIPEEDKITSTSLTSNALYYMGEYDMQHKVILIEDMDGAEAVLYALRELISKQQIIKLVPQKDSKGITKTIMFKVNGPVTVAGCTTQESIYEDNANRSFLVYIDESTAQDEAIMNHQRKKSAGTINTEEEKQIKQLLQNTQRILEPIQVRNPFAELLKIPTEVFKPRRTNAHYLQFIEAVTFYHQYQREQHTDETTGEIYINTTLEDIAAANKLMKEVLLRKADELSGATRNYFEQLKAILQEQKQTTFTNKEIRKQLRIPATTIRRYHNDLSQSGYIKLQENKKQQGYRYEIISYEEYQQLKNSIATVLDNILQSIRATKPAMSQLQNGSTKRKPAKALAAMSQ
jgi:predicted transcriptional regulator